jgi:hypothetical protein
LIDVTDKPEPDLVEIIDEPEVVEIIDDPGAVEVVEDAQAAEVASEADVVEIIDNPEVVEGSSLMKARDKVNENIPAVKKKTPPGKDRR